VILGFYVGGLDRVYDPFVLIDGMLVRASALPRLRPYRGGYLVSPMDRPKVAAVDLWLAEHFYTGTLLVRGLARVWDLMALPGHPSREDRGVQGLSSLDYQTTELLTRHIVGSATQLRGQGIRLVVMVIATQDANKEIPMRQKETARRLQDLLSSHGVSSFKTIPLIEATDESGGNSRLGTDAHWNAETHAVVGGELARRLMQELAW
jgi:hypothetical protein